MKSENLNLFLLQANRYKMKILLFLIIGSIAQNASSQSDTLITKRKILADSSVKLVPVLHPRTVSNDVTAIHLNNVQPKDNNSFKTYLYWDPITQMLIRKPYTSHYRDPKLLNAAQGILSFVIPNNAGKP
ncbi:MAG: hypothetical protein ACR2KZ_09835 [Segetibacter sp.]